MNPHGRAFAGLVLAMAHAKAGRIDVARRTLNEVEAKLEAERAASDEEDLGPEYFDWCYYKLLLPQARLVVTIRSRLENN
jgi:hypothetical protein